MYILVTHWDGFWDKIKSSPYYPNNLIVPANLQEGAGAIFIKIDEGRCVQHGWRGIVHHVRRERSKTYFDVTLAAELESSELREYEGLAEGWFERFSKESISQTEQGSRFFPAFFVDLRSTSDRREFEDLVYKLIDC